MPFPRRKRLVEFAEDDDDGEADVNAQQPQCKKGEARGPATIVIRHGMNCIRLGMAEIWDGADLALLREVLFDARLKLGKVIGVDMSKVRSIPSGTFGLFHSVIDLGKSIILLAPTQEIRNLTGFGHFCTKPHATIPDAYIFKARQDSFIPAFIYKANGSHKKHA